MQGLLLGLIAVASFSLGYIADDIKTQRRLEGIAKSNFIATYHHIDVPPEQARFFNINITTTDVSFSGAQITNFFEGDK